ncbi:mannosyl-oligosaccharide glucosidase GCS1 [Tanacetum coccineum]
MVVCRRPPSTMAVCRRPPSAMAVCRRPHRHHSSDHFNKASQSVKKIIEIIFTCWVQWPVENHLRADCMLLAGRLDLRCWMLLAADCMHSITEQLVNKKESGKAYEETTKLLADFDLLNKKHKMHYDKDYGAYFDYGNHTEKVRLRRKLVEKNGNQPSLELVREVLEKPELRLVPHIGYVSLFPFIWKIIPSTVFLASRAFVVNLGDMMEIWTNCILRVLPPHWSPFVDTEADGYVPEYVDTIQRIQATAIYIPLGSWLLSYHLEYLDIGFTQAISELANNRMVTIKGISVTQFRRKPPIPMDFRQKPPSVKTSFVVVVTP